MSRPRIEVGDYITFTAATRSDCKKARRKVTGIDHLGRPLVRYHGWSGFIVGAFPTDKIHKVEKMGAAPVRGK